MSVCYITNYPCNLYIFLPKMLFTSLPAHSEIRDIRRWGGGGIADKIEAGHGGLKAAFYMHIMMIDRPEC